MAALASLACRVCNFASSRSIAFKASPEASWRKPRKVLTNGSYGKAAAADEEPLVAVSAGETMIIVGAGVAGCTTAITMARRGVKVLLFERDMEEQDRIVGELMQPGGIRALERLGLDACAKEGIDSVQVDGYVVFQPNRGEEGMPNHILLSYPCRDPTNAKEFFGYNESKLPDEAPSSGANPKGRSFHNSRFVQNLRRVALKEANVSVVLAIVTSLIEKDGKVVGVEYKDVGKSDEGQEKEVKTAFAPLTVVADGLWSGLRSKVDSAAKPFKVSTFVGLILEHPPMESPLPYRGCGHVVLAEPSPILLYQISSTETRVLVDVAGKMPSASTGELAEHLRTKTAPQLPKQLQESFNAAVNRGNFKSMPNRAMHPASMNKAGVLLLGDALNMRHPLTGGGMTVAIRDAEAMCDLLTFCDIKDEAAMKRVRSTFLDRRVQYSSTINVLANALYAIFSTPGGNATRKDLRDACFDYLSMGGPYAAGPIGLLSGLTPVPSILATHFFCVAFYALKSYLLPFPSPKKLFRMYDIVHVACKIIMPLLEREKSSFLSLWPVRNTINLFFPYRQGLLQ